MELNLEMADLAAVLRDVVEAARPHAATSRNMLICSVPQDIGNARCDTAKFRNMVGQLLDNGIKFTQNGTVELVAERAVNDGRDELLVHVIDTGIGIAPDQIANLFEKFTVADDSSTSKYGGTGLGLALSQKLSRLMGGEILVDSRLGHGSRFTIRLPLIDATAPARDFAAATLVPLAEAPIFPATPIAVLNHA